MRHRHLKNSLFPCICLFMLLSLPMPFCVFYPNAFGEDTTEIKTELIENSEDDVFNSDLETDDEEDEESELYLSLTGFIEFEHFLNSKLEQDFTDAVKKNEIRNHFELRYGGDNFYFFIVSNQYYLISPFEYENNSEFRYAEHRDVSQNLTISSTNYEVTFNELYLNFNTEYFRLRLGNQIYGWGTADAQNPTAYFNPSDIREFLFRIDDEAKPGIPSVSGLFFLENITVELVAAPIHIMELNAPNGDFWAIKMHGENSILYTVAFDEIDSLSFKFENMGWGARLSGNFFDADMSLSVYHGPDNQKDAVKIPYEIVYPANAPPMAIIKPQYEILTMIGVDFSKAVSEFVFQFEAAYSPDKTALVEQAPKIEDLKWPFAIKKSEYIALSAGFNWFVPVYKLLENHEGESVFTFEYSMTHFFNDDISTPFIPNLVTVRYDDSFFESRLEMSFTAVFDTSSSSRVIWPRVEYIFQNGISIELSYGHITGTKRSKSSDSFFEPLFFYYEENDVLMGRLRYEY